MDPTHLEAGAFIAIASTEILQILKQASWFRWMTRDTASLNRLIGGLVAFLTGLGISFHYDAATGSLVVSGLLWASVTHGFAQWVQQQLYYRVVVAEKGPTQIVVQPPAIHPAPPGPPDV